MFVLVSYDIVDDDVRGKVAKVVLAYGRRVQKSVFECHVDDRRYIEMRNAIEGLINQAVDSVRYYSICRRCQGTIEVSGWGTVTEDRSDGIIII